MTVEIIAELGINHNGSFDTAKDLIIECSEIGLAGVKFQYRNIANTYGRLGAREIGDEILSAEIEKNYISPRKIIELADFAKSKNLKVGISFFNSDDFLDFTEKTGDLSIFDFFKIPSVELMNQRLVDMSLSFGRHVFISLGAHDENEIEEALSRLPSSGWTPMHCVSNYPSMCHNAKLGYIRHLQRRWNRPIGYSSHDANWEVCVAAIALGVSVIERHITLDKGASGLDHSSSSSPDEFRRLKIFAENSSLLLAGDCERSVNQGELLNRQNLGRSFFLSTDLAKGDRVKESHLVYRSPKVGIDYSGVQRFLGQESLVSAKAGTPLSRSLFEPSRRIDEDVIETCRRIKISLPVRMHDYEEVDQTFELGRYELHLSFGEIFSDISASFFNSSNEYSIHLPDYISSVHLINPFANDADQALLSRKIVNKTIALAQELEDRTGNLVPVVGSFSVNNYGREDFYEKFLLFNEDLKGKFNQGILLQWLPPIAWYFGGSVTLNVMNSPRDVQFISKNSIEICLDLCHMFLCRNAQGFDIEAELDALSPNVGHLHIADAVGVDGEGLPLGAGGAGNVEIVKRFLGLDVIKVCEVWQGHLDGFSGFKAELESIHELVSNG